MFPLQPFSSSSFQPFCEVIPICTNIHSWLWNEHYPALSIPLFLLQFILREKLLASPMKTEKLFWKPFFPPNSVLPDLLSLVVVHLLTSLFTLGGWQGIAVFPLISSTSKRYQHYFCCQLCLCDRLWTIWMYLHLAAIKAPRFRTPHLGLSTPHGAELASPQRPVLLHKHQTTSQNPFSTSLEPQAGEEMLLSNLRVGMCSVIESLSNKLQQLTQIILKEQTQTVFGVMHQRKVTDRERMLKKKSCDLYYAKKIEIVTFCTCLSSAIPHGVGISSTKAEVNLLHTSKWKARAAPAERFGEAEARLHEVIE